MGPLDVRKIAWSGPAVRRVESIVARFESPVIHVGSTDVGMRRTYGEVKPGEYLALINSFGVLEIARAEQSASDGLGIGRGAPVEKPLDARARGRTC